MTEIEMSSAQNIAARLLEVAEIIGMTLEELQYGYDSPEFDLVAIKAGDSTKDEDVLECFITRLVGNYGVNDDYVRHGNRPRFLTTSKTRKPWRTIGPRLARLRTTEGATIVEMAGILGCEPDDLDSYELSLSDPPARVLGAACRHFGVDAEYLLFGVEKVPPAPAKQVDGDQG